MSKFTFLLIAFGCASAFLIQDFKYNQTASQSSIGQHTSVEDSIRNLMTMITDEKRIRFQLENRLKTAEDKIDKMDQYNIAVSNEFEKEKKKVDQFEIMLDKVVREMGRNTSANCDCFMGNGSISITAAMENIMHDILIVKEEEKRIRDDTTELNNTLVSLRVDNLRTLERTKSDLSNITDIINSTLSDNILDINRQLKIVNASSQLDAIRQLKYETSQLNRTLSETVMNKTWLIQMQNSSLKSVQSESVGFTVNYADDRFDPVKFQNEEYNAQSAYNMTSGKFVCKQAGLYFFTLSILTSTGSDSVYCYFNKNGKTRTYSYAYANGANGVSDQYTSATNSILYQLHTGDHVYISNCTGLNNLSGITSFTGFLVSPTN